MAKFICDTCGREVQVIDGIVSWTREGNTLKNFKLTHKGDQCQPANNRYRELYTITLASGFMEFVQYLLERWEDGLELGDPQTLRKVTRQLNLHMHEKLLMLVEE
ncbi:hypothetical protein [Desulfotomaculum copahuensis]|uniref:Uncharacterized protein n=1 Tax=Desulfotomaculum copahuensis TaxID=1838280 RepID=A0A1B7LDX0_9FIRM|nr:hypothetical protein [Desulfotomaculum copahuensis]OAT81255.1 hypothetical protein A6M21_00190 [Desulfotomaculum copahuensis]